jgi:hypothetical protein
MGCRKNRMRTRFPLSSLFLAITVAVVATGFQLTTLQSTRGLDNLWLDLLAFLVAASWAPITVVWALTARWLWLNWKRIDGGGLLAAAILMCLTGEVVLAVGRGITQTAFATEPRIMFSVIAVLGVCKRVLEAGAWLLVACAVAKANDRPAKTDGDSIE